MRSRRLSSGATVFTVSVAVGATLALLHEAHVVEVAAPSPVAAPPAPAPAPVAAPAPPAARRRVTLRSVLNAAGLVLVLASIVFWALVLRPQSLGGPAGYVLVSGRSMLPRYHTGDLVLVEKHAHYHVGEVIAYHVPKGDPMAGDQVIHRIIGGDAQHGFLVKGDNRTAPDVWRPKPSDIVGAKLLRIPQAVDVLQFLRSPLLLALMAASFVFVRVLGFRGDEKTSDEGDDWLVNAA
ncbi:MAG TPA: signal peptidase I [Gaiellaceae bacterium]|nr:signal peptidase I [Gaiellaceae bacterium]